MDSIADMLVRMQSAIGVRKESVDIPFSKMKEGVAKIILAEGYIGKVETHTRMNKKHLRIGLKYDKERNSIIDGMKRVSKSGRRIYVGADKIPRVRSGFGTAIISTSRGLMTDEAARENKLGGEVVCYIW